MNTTGPSQTKGQSSAQLRFFQWASKWFYANTLDEDVTVKPDAPTLACLLQTMGFQLRQFERQDGVDDGLENETLRITIQCGTSKIKAVLDADNIVCKCPTTIDTKSASLWSISGTAPTNVGSINKIEETGCNLIPHLSKEVTAVLRDVSRCLLQMIDNEHDINHNSELGLNTSTRHNESTSSTRTYIARSYTQPEFTFSKRNCVLPTSAMPQIKREPSTETKDSQNKKANPALNKSALQRQETWVMDMEIEGLEEPRPSPPKITSSPVHLKQLCGSLDRFSLQSDDDNVSASFEYLLMKARENLEKGLKLYFSSKSRTASEFSLQDDKPFTKSTTVPKSDGRSSTSPRTDSRPGSSCSAPARITPQKPTLNKTLLRRNEPQITGKTSHIPAIRDSSKSIARRKSSISNLTPNSISNLNSNSLSTSLTVESLSRSLLSTKKKVSPEGSTMQKSRLSLLKHPSKLSLSKTSNPNLASKIPKGSFSTTNKSISSLSKVTPSKRK